MPELDPPASGQAKQHGPAVGQPLFERSDSTPARFSEILRDIGPQYITNGILGLVFAASGPIAVTLTVGSLGGLTQEEMASWVFAIFFSAGVATLLMSLLYRQPLGFAWSIPGTVLLGPSLQHLSFPEVVGAFFSAGVLILALGATGVVRRVMAVIPPPIIMAMVAAVFLRFGTDIVSASEADPAVSLPMVVTYLVLVAVPTLGKYLPPVLGALVSGIIAVMFSGRFTYGNDGPIFAAPAFTAPEFAWAAQLELVVPLALTVLVVQNGQGTAVLKAAGHSPPINVFAMTSGLFSLLNAPLGGISACVTGPTNALLTASGEKHRQYTAATVYALLALICALLAPALTRLMLSTPDAFVLTLGGLAMLRALQQAFITAFSTTFTLGALVTFMVTISGLNVLNMHAAFWGVVIGYAVSRLLEGPDYARS